MSSTFNKLRAENKKPPPGGMRIFGVVIIAGRDLKTKLEMAKEAGRDENRRLTSRVYE